MTEHPILTAEQRAFLADARRAILATRRPDGGTRLVPICFAVGGPDPMGRPILYSALDEKPKRDPDPHRLGRVRDLLVLPEATILVDRWAEDWDRLAWLRAEGRAVILEPEPGEAEEHAAAIAALREKYPQYLDQALETRPIIRIALHRAVAWGDLGGA